MKKNIRLDLRLFEGDGAAAAAAGSEASDTSLDGVGTPGGQAENHVEGAAGAAEEQMQKTPEQRAEEYGRLKTEYKDLYDKDVQSQINRRYRQNQQLKNQISAYMPLMDMLSVKYGVTSGKPEDIIAAINQDESFFEEAALKQNMTPEQYRRMFELNLKYKQAKDEADQTRAMQKRQETFERWEREAEVCKNAYPGMNLENEIQDERFVRLLNLGWDVKGAYEACHHDEILNGQIERTRKETRKQVADSIRAGAGRAAENGTGSNAASTGKIDVSKLTYAQMDEYIERAKAGEMVSF